LKNSSNNADHIYFTKSSVAKLQQERIYSKGQKKPASFLCPLVGILKTTFLGSVLRNFPCRRLQPGRLVRQIRICFTFCVIVKQNPVRDSTKITDRKCGTHAVRGVFRRIATATQSQPWIGLHRGIYCATHSGVNCIAGILSAGRLRVLRGFIRLTSINIGIDSCSITMKREGDKGSLL